MKNYFKEDVNGIDVTIDSVGYIDNKLPVCNFFDNIILNKPDSINVRFYTWEGEPIVRTINYDGKEINLIVYSNTNSNEIIQIFSGDNFRKEKKDILIEYNLYYKDKFIVRLLYYRN